MKAFPQPITRDSVNRIASGTTRGLQQSLLASGGQVAQTILAVAYSYYDDGSGAESPGGPNHKAQITSLGDGNVVFVYATGADFNEGVIQEGPIFLSLGEIYVIENVQSGTIITSTAGAYGYSQQRNGNDESPMPLLSLGLSFDDTFLFAFRESANYTGNGSSTNGEGWIHVVNGSINSTVTLTTGAGAVVQGQENIPLDPFEYRRLYTDGNQEYRLQSTNNVMAAINANMGTAPGFSDSRLILPLTSDGITWPRSGNLSALYNNTNVRAYINTGRKYQGYSTASWNTFVNGADKATGISFRTPNSFSDIGTPGMLLFESGGTGIGYSAVLNSSGEIDIYYCAGQSTPRITSTTVLSTGTDYIVVLETESTTPEVRLFIEQASDFTNYEAGTLTAEASATPPDTTFSGADPVNLFEVVSIGGFSGTTSGKVNFFGEFYHLKLGDFTFSGALDFELLESDVLLDFDVSPGSALNISAEINITPDYSQEGATRFIARGLISSYSGADGQGIESTPLCPLNNFSQRIALPLAITFDTETSVEGSANGISIASAFECEARLYEWNSTTGQAELVTVNQPAKLGGGTTTVIKVNRQNITPTTADGQLIPAAAAISPAAAGTENAGWNYNYSNDFSGGYIETTAPCMVVFNSAQNKNGGTTWTFRGTTGASVVGIHAEYDEQLSFGITPDELATDIKRGADGLLYIRKIGAGGTDSWEVA